MNKKPSLNISKEKQLRDAHRELASENVRSLERRQTTVLLEPDVLYGAKEVALNRKRAGVEPSTLTGIIQEALKAIIKKELNT